MRDFFIKTLLYCSVLLFFNCQTEEEVTDIHQHQELTINRITHEEFTNKTNALEKFNQLINKNREIDGRMIYNSFYDFTVDTDNILMIQKGEYDSYTFPVYRTNDSTYIENLVLSQLHDKSYSATLIKYMLTKEDKENFENEKLLNLQDKTILQILDPGTLNTNDLLTSRRTRVCITVSYPACKYGGTRHIAGENCTQPDGTINVTSCYYLGEENDDPSWIDPNVPEQGGGGGGSSSDPPVITEPLLVDMRRDKDCKKIKNSLTTTAPLNYKQKLVNLAALVNDPINEHGIGLDSGGNLVTFPSGPDVNINGNGTAVYKVISHIHNNTTVGTFSIFSFSDLIAFAKLMKNNRIDSGTFVATLSTSKGTHYALTISDVEKFKEFFFHKLHNLGSLDILESAKYSAAYQNADKFQKKYFDHPNGKIKVSDTNNANVLNEFLNFMKEADIGIALFETDATFQNFAKVTKDTQGNIKKDNCN